MAWLGRDIKFSLQFQTPAACWLPPTRSGCLKPYPVSISAEGGSLGVGALPSALA